MQRFTMSIGSFMAALAVSVPAGAEPRGNPPAREARAPSQLSKEAHAAAQGVVARHHASRERRDALQELARVLRDTEHLLLRLMRPAADEAAVARLSDHRRELERLVATVRERRSRRRVFAALADPVAQRCAQLFEALDAVLATSDAVERARAASALRLELVRHRPDHGKPMGSPTFRAIPRSEIQRVRDAPSSR